MTGLLCWIFFLHFVADFLCQPRWMAKQKSEQPAILLLHTVIIWIVMLLGLALTPEPTEKMIYFSFANAFAHGLTDMFSWKGYKWYALRQHDKMREEKPYLSSHEYKYWEDHWFYATIGFDQLLHGLALILLAGWLL